jgi:Glycosyltransferase family 87
MLASPFPVERGPVKLGLPQRGRLAVLFVLLGAAIAASLWHLHLLNQTMPSTHSDLLVRWVGTRDAFRGIDPYSAQASRDIQAAYYGKPLTAADKVDPQAFLYPAPIVVLLAPLAPLSWGTVRLLFLLIMPLLIGAGVLLSMKTAGIQVSRGNQALIVLLSLASWPIMWGLRQQQPTLVVLALVLVACYLLKIGRGIPAGALLALTTIKPQMVAPLILWLLLWTVLRRSWGFVSGFVATLSILLLATERILPGWMGHWRASLHGYGQFTHTALPLELMLSHWPGVAATGLIAAGSGIVLWSLRRCDADSPEFGWAIALALATTVTAAPMKLSMVYNQVFLIPALLILVFASPLGGHVEQIRRLALALLAWNFISVPVAVAGETLFSRGGFWDALPFLNLPLVVLPTIALAMHCWVGRDAWTEQPTLAKPEALASI